MLGGHVEFNSATLAAMSTSAIFPSFVGYVFWNRGVPRSAERRRHLHAPHAVFGASSRGSSSASASSSSTSSGSR
jgi:hypothetical protein